MAGTPARSGLLSEGTSTLRVLFFFFFSCSHTLENPGISEAVTWYNHASRHPSVPDSQTCSLPFVISSTSFSFPFSMLHPLLPCLL